MDGRRFYAAFVFIPLFYLLLRYGPPVAFFGLVLGSALVAQMEFYRLYFRADLPLLETTLGMGLLALFLAAAQWPGAISIGTVGLASLAAVLISRLLSGRDLRHGLTDSAVLLFGVCYLGLTLGTLLPTRQLAGGEFLIFFLFLVTWAGDTGAYFVGVNFGKRPLAPVISPSKTVEGLLGGLALAVAAAFLARAWFLPSFSPADCLATGLLLTLAGVLGDLTESVLKRSAGVKDSGGIIPAHGGMLDRLDSVLFAAPAFYYYVTLIKQ
jgi:phosphatidate cytidylyltransferase